MFMYEDAAFYFPQISQIGAEFRAYLRYQREKLYLLLGSEEDSRMRPEAAITKRSEDAMLSIEGVRKP